MSKKVADLLVEMLANAGVKRIYAITGDSLNPVNDAVRRDGRLQWIHVRHEEAAAYAASMDAELNGIGCCMGSSGPGHVHLVNGLYDANRAGNPVIAIASTITTDKLGQDNFQETNPFFLFKDCSKYVYMANTPEQFTHIMQAAIQAAISQQGVAVVGLPGDVAASDCADIPTSTVNYLPQPRIIPSGEELQKMADILNNSNSITLYCGHGCKDAVAAVKQLAGILQSPVTYSFRGKIFFDTDDNEFACGMNGLLGHRSGYEAMNKAEVLIMLGTDFPYVEFLPEKNTIIQIDRDASRIGRRAKVDVGLVGDIKDTIKDLLPLLKQKENNNFLAERRKAYNETEEDLESFASHKGTPDNIQPEYVAYLLNKYAQSDAIFTVDTGMTAVWAARFIKGASGRYLTGSFNHGSMANAMPMSIGAAVSTPQRQVIALCGDGGISMLLGDLITIMQYNLPVKIIVFNNRCLGMVKLEMQVAGYVDWQTDMVNPPFEKIAEAMNFKSCAVHDPEALENELKEILAHDGPALMNVFTNSDALAMPPHVEFSQMKGFLTSMVKLISEGKTGEMLNTVKSNIRHLKELF